MDLNAIQEDPLLTNEDSTSPDLTEMRDSDGGVRRDSLRMLRKIPVRMTLEVGTATLPLSDVLALEPGSVVELNRLAGEPLVIKVNGTPIGRAEVVVAGENYGLKIVELEDLESLHS